MQSDMHYHATFAMARAAGFRSDIARAIATSAEYVDDSDRLDVICKDGFKIHAEPTAHHPTDFKANTDPTDQRRTWVPFHFVPGLDGHTDEEKLICTTDSKTAKLLIQHTLNSLEMEFAMPLLGIMAHSFMDTFSHYGFSGISSALNRVDSDSFDLKTSEATASSLITKFETFFARFAVGPLANHLVQLGHGSVATYPDQPFLTWQFDYEAPRRPSGERDNTRTFLAACRRLHETFVEARTRFNGVHDDPKSYRDFSDIEAAVNRVLAVEGGMADRANAWTRAMQAGHLTGTPEPIPDYDSSMFTYDLTRLSQYEEGFAKRTLVFAFLQAAEYQRSYLLNDVLPIAGLHIEATKIEWHS